MKKPSIKVGNNRLLKLAEFLRTVPRKRFNYSVWVGKDWGGKQDLSCGTSACALGWAASMPKFQRLGLRIDNISTYEKNDFTVVLDDVEAAAHFYGATCNYDRISEPFAAAEYVFGLSEDEAQYLFAPCEDEDEATPNQVAAKIEKFVANDRRYVNDDVEYWRDADGKEHNKPLEETEPKHDIYYGHYD